MLRALPYVPQARKRHSAHWPVSPAMRRCGSGLLRPSLRLRRRPARSRQREGGRQPQCATRVGGRACAQQEAQIGHPVFPVSVCRKSAVNNHPACRGAAALVRPAKRAPPVRFQAHSDVQTHRKATASQISTKCACCAHRKIVLLGDMTDPLLAAGRFARSRPPKLPTVNPGVMYAHVHCFHPRE